MGFETNKIFDYLYKKFTREGYRSTFPDLFQTFSSCSIDQTHCLPLVASTIRSINFDLLTRRLYRQQGNIPQSADAMSFAKDYKKEREKIEPKEDIKEEIEEVKHIELPSFADIPTPQPVKVVDEQPIIDSSRHKKRPKSNRPLDNIIGEEYNLK